MTLRGDAGCGHPPPTDVGSPLPLGSPLPALPPDPGKGVQLPPTSSKGWTTALPVQSRVQGSAWELAGSRGWTKCNGVDRRCLQDGERFYCSVVAPSQPFDHVLQILLKIMVISPMIRVRKSQELTLLSRERPSEVRGNLLKEAKVQKTWSDAILEPLLCNHWTLFPLPAVKRTERSSREGEQQIHPPLGIPDSCNQVSKRVSDTQEPSMAQTEDAIETSALGRPFQLGMLYDCRKDALIPGVTLWDYSSLQKDLTIKPQPKTESEIIASDSIDDKSSALDISASLKASFLGGLVEVGGSAKYLHDKKKSKQQARVTVQYKTTTKYEQLTMSHLGIQNISYPAVFDHGTATHVVTAILYGAQAFFVFDREVSSTEMVKDIQGSLQLTVKNLISITGEAEVKLTEKEKENALKFSCKFHGDFSLEKNPVTFQDAMKVYETLPKLLGEHGEKAVPMRVWLYPLTKLDTRAAKMVREISLTLIFDAEKILEELNENKMQSNDLAKNPIAETFPEIQRKIQQFKDLCKQHRQTFQKQLARMLPSIRGGGQEEGTLVDILMSINQSPFNSQRLREFLDSKKREMNFVKSYLTILSEIQVISSQNKLEEIVLDPQNVHVVSFTFTSLHEEETFLLSLQKWLQEQFLQESAKSTRRQEEDMPWFEDKERTRNARQAAKSIRDFFSINQSNEKVRFVVASLPKVATPGASIYLYEDGELVSKNFELPSKPLQFLISELRHDSIQLKFQPAEYGKATISSYLVEYKIAGEENWKTMKTEDTREMFLLKDLPPNTEYQFQYTACCKVGLSKTSDLSPPIKTLPTSPPEELRMVTAASSVISVAWMSPSIVASGVVIKEYKVEYRMVEAGAGKDQWTEKRTGRKTEFYPIEDLKPQMMYRIRVSAVCDNGALSGPSVELEVSTLLEEEDGGNIAHQFLQESSLVEDKQPLVFTLPLKEVPSDASTPCLMYQLGKENLEVPNKVILVMGATGCGKTTLINGMINYILGVQWEDNFRFKLIHETTQRSEAGSRMSEVTAYMVNHQKGFRIPYSLTIIDTPGFGGRRDAEQDKLLEKQLLEFFSTPGGIDHMDAICLVAEAFFAHSNSTHTQKCIFDSMLSMLGKDMKDNIQLLITFADGGTPPVLEALKEADLPCAQDESGTPLHFRFNHSALFAPRENGGSPNIVAKMFWKMSTKSMKDFFDSLKMLEAKDLTLTMKVLKERQSLDTALEGLQTKLRASLMELEELKEIQVALQQCTINVLASRNFEYKVGKCAKEHVQGPVMYCPSCSTVCHYNCHNDGRFERCDAMNNEAKCLICPGRCCSSSHAWKSHYEKTKIIYERKFHTELKRQYEEAKAKKNTLEEKIKSLDEKFDEIRLGIKTSLDQSCQCLENLREIALKPVALSMPEDEDLRILTGKQELKTMQSVMDMRRLVESLQKLPSGI
ncbi:uncharacterized protein LOC117659866 [Pantherophis guttatus]|uniref:Uncharacterized protein LOC117659866 n=1 Tax=Pantherophis guttatus TaxID=94885 RepID=A0ABM3ZMW4_PANGU|nr:uncharacterized protein LOC117659866 [Pantherophis guttatus]